ncbi:MAG: hypothetical protein OXP28_14850, partial [Gammaproteobacteria bacterium]|nr:hypothetical protein [Gammaproteobacteria bacterium]
PPPKAGHDRLTFSLEYARAGSPLQVSEGNRGHAGTQGQASIHLSFAPAWKVLKVALLEDWLE